MKQSLFMLRKVRNVSRMCGQNALWLSAEGGKSIRSTETPLCVKSAIVLHSFGNEAIPKTRLSFRKVCKVRLRGQ